MSLLPDVIVERLRDMPGATHSFLRQLCEPEGVEIREGLERALQAMPPSLGQMLRERLSSLDNRVFFQGFSELVVASVLSRAGWEVSAGSPGGLLRGTRPGGEHTNVLVLGFIHSHRPGLDQSGVRRLVQALERVATNLRFAVFVRRWLPPEFGPEPVRRAVELWLRECEEGTWEGEHAAYEDDGVALEFRLTGGQVQEGQSPVAMTLGPFVASRVMMALEQRVVLALDRYRLGASGDEAVVVAAVADQPWQLTQGYVREFLYGKPRFVATVTGDVERGEAVSWEAGLSPDREPCLFKDSVYRDVSGVWLLNRAPEDPLGILGKAYANPFARVPLTPGDCPLPTLHGHRQQDGLPVVSWVDGSSDSFRLGERH